MGGRLAWKISVQTIILMHLSGERERCGSILTGSLHGRGTNGWKTGLEDISADYHTYALERREGKMRFYFDGQLAWEKTSREDSFVELSRHMVLSLEGHLGAPEEQYLPGEKMRFYFDGQLAWEKTSREDSFVELSRHMVLSLEGHLGAPEEQYLPGEVLVDYVRTYYDSDFAGLRESVNYQIVNQESNTVLDLSERILL